jgi:hypothetical protein
MRVADAIPLGRPFFLPVHTVTCVRTLNRPIGVEGQEVAGELTTELLDSTITGCAEQSAMCGALPSLAAMPP